MILPFRTQINGNETFFVEKIHAALSSYFHNRIMYNYKNPAFNLEIYNKCEPKLHTIREDKNNRWKSGITIDFFINVRTKKMFRFAPKVPVVSTQTIEIKYIGFSDGFRPWVKIDGKNVYTLDQIESEKMLKLANNDGFDTIQAFFDYFNKDFVGKIIHWTTLKY
jgi:hypothetical protein